MNPVNPPQNPSPAPGAENLSSENQNTGDRSTPKQKISAAARSATDQIKRVASDTASQIKTEAQKIAESRREQAAQRIESDGTAAHRSAQEIERDDPNIAWLGHRVADRLQGAANYVRGRDFASLRADTEDYARNHPAVFFGGLFVAGLVLGNCLKATSSSVSRPARSENRDGRLPEPTAASTEI